MPNQQYDPQVYHKNHETHFVCARVYVPNEGPERQFDAEIVAAYDDRCVVRSGAVEQPIREFTIPASCVCYMYVGSSRASYEAWNRKWRSQ
jgi:hypothetical protein